MGKRLAKKLLVIGWDAADWKVINPMIDRGELPTLEKLINNGVMGNLATLDPPMSPILWTSIATGKRPYKHGVLGFTEPKEDGSGIRPVLTTSRKVKAVWNILTQHKLKTHTVGWWPSHPAEPINGISISNFYQRANVPFGKPWPMATGTVHPEEKAEFFSKLRLHPGELTANHLQPFFPNIQEIINRTNSILNDDNADKESDEYKQAVITKKRVDNGARILADASTIHAATTYILENEDWDFLAVYYDAIDHWCHGFMKFHPPKMEHVTDQQFDDFKSVIEAGYKFHDMMLERLIQLAGEDATILLISDHGFHPDHLRPKVLPKEPAAPALEHSPYGIFCVSGPGIKKDERVYGASILDITPTLLSLLGLPIGKDMDGKPLVGVYEEPPQLDFISSWEDIPGECGMHPEEKRNDPYLAQETLNQLVELGYIDKPDEDAEKAVKRTVDENNFYLARSYIGAKRYHEAAEILEQLSNENPEQTRFSLRLITCYQNLGKIAEARDLFERTKEHLAARPTTTKITEVMLLMSEGKNQQALSILNQLSEQEENPVKLHGIIGRNYMILKDWNAAEQNLLKELEHNPENAGVLHSLGVCALRLGKLEEAIERLLDSIGLLYFQPNAHYHLGQTLYASGDFEGAARAFEVTLHMNPNIRKAKTALVKIYEEKLPNEARLNELKGMLEEHVNKTEAITVVSGLPRSGTSMIMQMLEAGGVEIFSDGKRTADESNPKGYFEHEGVKGLMRNKAFINDAVGKAVKVITQLLPALPGQHHYKVIYINRSLDEVMKSQHAMLVRDGKAKQDSMPLKMIQAFEDSKARFEAWYPSRKNMEFLFLEHSDAIRDPQNVAESIQEFLGVSMPIDEMVKVVDKSLHREKADATIK